MSEPTFDDRLAALVREAVRSADVPPDRVKPETENLLFVLRANAVDAIASAVSEAEILEQSRVQCELARYVMGSRPAI